MSSLFLIKLNIVGTFSFPFQATNVDAASADKFPPCPSSTTNDHAVEGTASATTTEKPIAQKGCKQTEPGFSNSIESTKNKENRPEIIEDCNSIDSVSEFSTSRKVMKIVFTRKFWFLVKLSKF